jgi:hypothetical protein
MHKLWADESQMLFFGSKCERLCLLQFALLSLMPRLMSHLDDCAHPSLSTPTKVAAPERGRPRVNSKPALLEYIGLPLPVFGEGAFFGPYTPLQHLDILASYSTKSYVVGSTNSLLLQSQSRYADVLVNLDDEPISITVLSPSLKQALQLSAADRRWIDFLTQAVMDTWDPDNPSRPKNMGFGGSEQAIRIQFEEYILALCSCAAYQAYRDEIDIRKSGSANQSRSQSRHRPSEEQKGENLDADQGGQLEPTNTNTIVDLIDADPVENAHDFGEAYLAAWRETRNYQTFIANVSNKRIFEMIEPRHPTAGGFNIDDMQRRLQQNIADLHLDERVRVGREQAGKMYEVGRERWKEGMGRFWAEIEKRRGEKGEARKENEAPVVSTQNDGTQGIASEKAAASGNWTNALRERAGKVQAPDTKAMQAAAKENAAKAGAYLSSWGSWARDRGKEWNEQRAKKGAEGGGGGEASAAVPGTTSA